MAQNIFVSLPPYEAAERIHQTIIGGSVTGEAIDRCQLNGRAGNRLTLTVTVDNLQGPTRIHLVSGGGGEGLFRFDWGASKSFESSILEVLGPYRI